MTTTRIEPSGLLRLLTWLSPAFPTGAYAYSHGLEWSIDAGDVTDAATLAEWLRDILAHGAGRSDAILLRHAHRAAHDPDRLAELVEFAAAAQPSRERQMETLAQGSAFVMAAASWHVPALDHLRTALPGGIAYPVAVGALCGGHLIAEDDACLALLHAMTASIVSAAVRLVPLGQSAGLAVLASLEPLVIATADAARAATLDDIGGACFRVDIAAMQHETQHTRLFRT